MTKQEKKFKKILDIAISKDGLKMPEDTTFDKISATSIYYMRDKDVYQLKMWIYPTNTSKTYNIAIQEKEIPRWLEFFKVSHDDDFFDDEEDVGDIPF